MEKKRA